MPRLEWEATVTFKVHYLSGCRRAGGGRWFQFGPFGQERSSVRWGLILGGLGLWLTLPRLGSVRRREDLAAQRGAMVKWIAKHRRELIRLRLGSVERKASR